jgi:hypothetical protein
LWGHASQRMVAANRPKTGMLAEARLADTPSVPPPTPSKE